MADVSPSTMTLPLRSDVGAFTHLLLGNRLLKLYIAPGRVEQAAVAVLCAVLLVGVWLLVWETGLYVYVHLAYAPIVIAALFFGGRGGLLAGIAAGVLVGPLINHAPVVPLLSVDFIETDKLGWVFRLMAFTAFGAVSGIVLSMLRKMTIRALERGYLDETTNLPNQQYMERVLTAISAAGGHCAVYVVHVSVYRDVQATFGAEMAGTLVQEMACRLTENLPESALLFRLYEGRFGLIVPGDTRAGQETLLVTETNRPVETSDLRLMPRVTLGKCECEPMSAEPVSAIRRAVLAAYDAEETGVAWSEYHADSDTHYREQLVLLSDLNRALGTDQLYLVYQPKVRLADGGVVGCEALIRWRHPERGMVSPADFIPVLERSGLIHEVTRAVITEAARQAVAWQRQGVRIPVSVNISAHDLSRPDFTDLVLGIIAEEGIDSDLLDLEVTESAAFRSDSDVHDNLRRIREAGIQVSIDDYGTGMSSLYYLREIPATTLKIDQLFIKTLIDNDLDRQLVRSTIDLCRSLDITTVAEGIESAEIAALLKTLGCTVGQGYHFARPMPPDELAAMVREEAGRGLRPAPSDNGSWKPTNGGRAEA